MRHHYINTHLFMQDYIQSIGACLVQSGQSMQGPQVDMLHHLTAESSQLLGCIKLLNHKVHTVMLQGQMGNKLTSAHYIDKSYKTYVIDFLSCCHDMMVLCLEASRQGPLS